MEDSYGCSRTQACSSEALPNNHYDCAVLKGAPAAITELNRVIALTKPRRLPFESFTTLVWSLGASLLLVYMVLSYYASQCSLKLVQYSSSQRYFAFFIFCFPIFYFFPSISSRNWAKLLLSRGLYLHCRHTRLSVFWHRHSRLTWTTWDSNTVRSTKAYHSIN